MVATANVLPPEMSSGRVGLGIAFAWLCLSPVLTHAACSVRLTESLVRAERIVDSLRPEKSGQQRVFAVDGSEYTAGQAAWMRAQLSLVLRSCARGDESDATMHLQGVLDLLRAHHSAL